MSDHDDFEALFHDHLPFIRKVVVAVAGRMGLRSHVDDFEMDVLERLWQNDYEALRKWRGESKVTTYLAVVIANYGREFRVKLWGRWRASAAAVKLGPLAVRLEMLISRDQMRLIEAGELLRTRGETTWSDGELFTLLAKLPHRTGDVEVPLETVHDDAETDARVLGAETDTTRRSVHDMLLDAIDRLAPEARVVITMHYLDGLTLADVARALGVDQRPLYRTKDRALVALRRRLLDAGVDVDQLRQLIGGDLDGDDLGDDGHSTAAPNRSANGNPNGSRPSKEVCDSNSRDETSGSSASEQSERSDS